MAINYSQWIAFAKYSYKQLKWVLLEKPELRDAYVRGLIAEELNEVYAEIDNTISEMSEEWDLHINNLGLPMYDVPNAVEEFRIMH